MPVKISRIFLLDETIKPGSLEYEILANLYGEGVAVEDHCGDVARFEDLVLFVDANHNGETLIVLPFRSRMDHSVDLLIDAHVGDEEVVGWFNASGVAADGLVFYQRAKGHTRPIWPRSN